MSKSGSALITLSNSNSSSGIPADLLFSDIQQVRISRKQFEVEDTFSKSAKRGESSGKLPLWLYSGGRERVVIPNLPSL